MEKLKNSRVSVIDLEIKQGENEWQRLGNYFSNATMKIIPTFTPLMDLRIALKKGPHRRALEINSETEKFVQRLLSTKDKL